MDHFIQTSKKNKPFFFHIFNSFLSIRIYYIVQLCRLYSHSALVLLYMWPLSQRMLMVSTDPLVRSWKITSAQLKAINNQPLTAVYLGMDWHDFIIVSTADHNVCWQRTFKRSSLICWLQHVFLMLFIEHRLHRQTALYKEIIEGWLNAQIILINPTCHRVHV